MVGLFYKAVPVLADEDRIGGSAILKLRRSNGIYSAKVRWSDYGPKDDSWEPLENLSRNLVIRFLRLKKKKIASYSWSIPNPPSRGTH